MRLAARKEHCGWNDATKKDKQSCEFITLTATTATIGQQTIRHRAVDLIIELDTSSTNGSLCGTFFPLCLGPFHCSVIESCRSAGCDRDSLVLVVLVASGFARVAAAIKPTN